MTAASITVQGNTAYLAVDDPEVYEEVVNATSFQLEGAEFRVRDHRRDKRTKLVRNRKCPVGLLDRVCRVLTLHGVTPEVHYASEPQPKPRVSVRVVGVEPWEHQCEAELAALLDDRGIFRIPTGGGKTLVTAMVVAAKAYQAVVVVPTIDLLHQTKDYLSEHLAAPTFTTDVVDGLPTVDCWRIGQLGDGLVDTQPVTVATIRTLAKVLDVAYESYEYAEYDDRDETEVRPRELKDWVESLGTVVVDEAHQLGAKVIYDTVTKIPAPCKYGLSASPWRDDGADLMIEAATGPPIYYASPRRLVQAGLLMAPQIRIIDTSKWWTSAAWGQTCARCGKQWLAWIKACTCGGTKFRSQWQESYKQEIVENEVRNGKIAATVNELVASGRSVLVLVKQVKHGRDLAASIPGAVFLSGQNRGDDRHEHFDAMRQGQLPVLVTTQIGDMGLDIPQLGALVLAGGGKSSTRHLQRIGRVVRTYPGKLRPIVVDLDDSHIHSWYGNHVKARRAIEKAEWGDLAEWVHE